MPNTKITLLDCTLRDGGYYNNWDFGPEVVTRYLKSVYQAGINAVEIGFRFLHTDTFIGPFGHSTDEYLELVLPKERPLIGVMVDGKDLVTCPGGPEKAVDHLFRPAHQSPVDLVRVACHFKDLQAALPALIKLKSMGYQLGLNLMQATTRTRDEIRAAARLVEEVGCVDVLYFADSLGNMTPAMVRDTICALREGWTGPLGIHTHDNQSRALANSMEALSHGVTWLDATMLGMGRGAGNARMEYLTFELAQQGYSEYEPQALFSLVLSDFEPLQKQYAWGPNLLYYLSGAYGIHPTYVQDMLVKQRYQTHEMLSGLEILRGVDGSSYSTDKLEEAMNGTYNGVAEGTWDATDQFKDRSVLLIGGGPSLTRHLPAVLRFIEKEKPFVFCLNMNSQVPESSVDAYVACHPSMLAMECDTYSTLSKPLLAPLGAIPSQVREKMPEATVWNFGMAVKEDTLEVSSTGCVIPELLAVAYVLAATYSGNAERVWLAGFDGFGPNDPRQRQSDNIFALFSLLRDSPPISAITPTTYCVNKASVYAPPLVA